MNRRLAAILGLPLLLACSTTFARDVAFLRRHTEVVVLSDRDGQAQVALCPALQGRVMTSTASGPGGLSFGWINYDLLSSGKTKPHINAYGGEDRFWLGPEGGQFSIFFPQGAPQTLERWQTPAPIDSEPWILAERDSMRALLRKTMRLANASGAAFNLEVVREVKLLTRERAWKEVEVADRMHVNVVAFETVNRIENVGREPWKYETGLLSVWILGMFKPSDETTVVIPFRVGPPKDFGPIVNDVYFGKVPADRLVARGGALFFKGDGRHRSKIGVSPRRAKPVLGSYDAENGVLTLVQYTLPDGNTVYVNSLWELPQKEPYGGDAVNSYNDGPPEPGKKSLGPFYELESSSPAAGLPPGKALKHVHRTFHFRGPDEDLDEVARATLGVSLETIRTALPQPP